MADEFCPVTGKIKHSSERQAIRAAKTTMQKKPKRRDRRKIATTFKCLHCGHFHWGHGKGEEPKK